MEHVILLAICTLIIRNALPKPRYDESEAGTEEYHLANKRNFTSYVIGIPLCAAPAVPLWVAFEVIYWVGNYFLA
jgi:hypothetical protein